MKDIQRDIVVGSSVGGGDRVEVTVPRVRSVPNETGTGRVRKPFKKDLRQRDVEDGKPRSR